LSVYRSHALQEPDGLKCATVWARSSTNLFRCIAKRSGAQCANRRSPEGSPGLQGIAGADTTAVGWRRDAQLPETRALRARRARCRLNSEFRLKPFRTLWGLPLIFAADLASDPRRGHAPTRGSCDLRSDRERPTRLRRLAQPCASNPVACAGAGVGFLIGFCFADPAACGIGPSPSPSPSPSPDGAMCGGRPPPNYSHAWTPARQAKWPAPNSAGR